MGKALPQLRWIFIAFADVEKAASAVNGDIHPAVGVEIYSKFTDGGIRQCQDALHAAKGQDAKGCRFIVAAQIEAFVEDSLPVLMVLALNSLSSLSLGRWSAMSEILVPAHTASTDRCRQAARSFPTGPFPPAGPR